MGMFINQSEKRSFATAESSLQTWNKLIAMLKQLKEIRIRNKLLKITTKWKRSR
jgi:hypothetical protein